MVEMLKKSIFATIGIALMTRDKIEDIGQKISQEASLSEADGKKFVDELLKRADETRVALEKTVAHHVESAIKRIHLATRADIETLERRIENLEKSVSGTPR